MFLQILTIASSQLCISGRQKCVNIRTGAASICEYSCKTHTFPQAFGPKCRKSFRKDPLTSPLAACGNYSPWIPPRLILRKTTDLPRSCPRKPKSPFGQTATGQPRRGLHGLTLLVLSFTTSLFAAICSVSTRGRRPCNDSAQVTQVSL